MWSIARRWSSRCRRRRSSVSTWARSPPAAGAAAPGSVTAVSVAISCVTIRPSPTSGGRLFPQAVERLFQGDHLQFAPDHHLLEFLQVQDLLLQLRLGLLEVPDHLLVGPHVAEYADGADDLAVGVAEGGGVEVVEMTSPLALDRKSTRLNSSHLVISYAVFCLKKK